MYVRMMCLCVCLCVCVCDVSVCTCMYVCTWIFMHVTCVRVYVICLCAHMHTCVTCLCICVCVCTCAHMCAHNSRVKSVTFCLCWILSPSSSWMSFEFSSNAFKSCWSGRALCSRRWLCLFSLFCSMNICKS